jgi:hypothetical protein
MNKFQCNLGALVSLWLNECLQNFLFDQTGRLPEAGKLFRPAAGLNSEPLWG